MVVLHASVAATMRFSSHKRIIATINSADNSGGGWECSDTTTTVFAKRRETLQLEIRGGHRNFHVRVSRFVIDTGYPAAHFGRWYRSCAVAKFSRREKEKRRKKRKKKKRRKYDNTSYEPFVGQIGDSAWSYFDPISFYNFVPYIVRGKEGNSSLERGCP